MQMERHVMWSPVAMPGMEHVRVAMRPDEVVADGIVLGVENNIAFRLRYAIRCDVQWRVRHVRVTTLHDEHSLSLTATGDGRWFDAASGAVPLLDGCVDVDITATPLTNTLPIRRLALQPGESADIQVAYITIPELHVTRDEQRYTCVDANATIRRYTFEQTGTGFTAELRVDADGFVEDYPELFRRVWAR
jgi:hypothetical protein